MTLWGCDARWFSAILLLATAEMNYTKRYKIVKISTKNILTHCISTNTLFIVLTYHLSFVVVVVVVVVVVSF